MSALREQISNDMKQCMKSGDKARLLTIRGILAAIKQIEIDTRQAPDDAQVLAVLNKLVKQRKDSISQFTQAGRTDLAEVEQFELTVLQHYLPEGLSEAQIEQMIAEAIADSGAKSPADMGKVMALVKPKMAGLADMGVVSARIKALLAN
ncbi:MAG: glutamyl-tRNA amidotransferase [Thiotrichales bacterium 32-46-8]|nr:GatB/YqeY domain-containing protein [Gammaproteobacteria bacterium]OYX07524.1 MAG: glutamyl-tRNA amidotransferase [Thiotrichales bacterium 32-46-8]OYY25455.1 MAG: glutamyl-tRNA amidotransferase [Thiotrichales bacterium 35-46-9]OYZ06441.1 MAG: glutamyl-tRNA amidotransferase [Thiotrichales bacterium 16-46-22]OZA16403.1 MAG: glutamyl-tRNA amidotransferase [Thiotrichales bacterium 17-46-47]OZA75118.1 MAG: glutamyl-tRNA amidotransferase [Thiotrichales bacterium 39-47-5]OZA97875.1 MAG: glutamyl-